MTAMPHRPGDGGGFFRTIVEASVRHRLLALAAGVGILLLGLWSAPRLPLDVTPDIGNVQVQVLTAAPGLSPQESESSVTRTIELEMFGLPGLEEVRSLTRYGVSQVCLIFADQTELYRARQMVSERLTHIGERLPRGLVPRLAPPSSGLGEVFTYTVGYRAGAEPKGEDEETLLRRLKLAQDFVVKPCLKSVTGVTEVNTTGGYDQQLLVAVDPAKVSGIGLDLADICNVVERNASIGGGAIMESDGMQTLARSRARAQTPEDLRNISVKLSMGGETSSLGGVADVRIGSGVRLGAATLNGHEAVLGTAIMANGANARQTARAVRAALEEAGKRLPAGMEVRPLYDRAELTDSVIHTVWHNLAWAAALVIAVLLVFLRNWRAALIVASILFLSFALGVSCMAAFGIMGSLLTLGAIDFGVVVDDTIVMVENVSRELAASPALDAADTRRRIVDACCRVRKPMFAGMLVIIGAYLPILGLGGVEGRMFRPLAESVILLLLASLLLTLAVVPALCALGLGGGVAEEPGFMRVLKRWYAGLFAFCRRRRPLVAGAAMLVGAGGILLAMQLGANFLPCLDEGWTVVEVEREPGVGLRKSVEMELRGERAIRDAVPEVAEIFARIGMSEIATDPQGPNQNDIYIGFKPRSQWRQINGRKATKAELAAIIKSVLEAKVPGQELVLNQPVALRFDELLEGVRSDVALKIYGPDYDKLDALAERAAGITRGLAGTAEAVIERPGRIPTMEFLPARPLMLQYMATADSINNAVSIGLAGREVGRVYDGDIFYPIVVRVADELSSKPDTLNILPARAGDGTLVLGLGNLGRWEKKESVGTIAREQGRRREAILIRVARGDVAGYVAALRQALEEKMQWPEGYSFEIGGAFQSWQSGSRALGLGFAVYLAAGFALIVAALGSARQGLLAAAGVPFAMIGGVYGLALAGLPFTIPAAVGFVTLGGLSILNGLVLMTCFNQLREEGLGVVEAALESAKLRLRPVLMTALVAGAGFAPMAFSTGQGAELQRPFAIVVICGVLTSTAMSLVLVPWLLAWDAGHSSLRLR